MNICSTVELVPEALKRFFAEHPRVALAFSGGCDSAYLFYAAVVSGADVGVYYVNSCFQPAFELEDARRLAAQLGRKINVIPADVLADAKVRANPADRCYYCKKNIFSSILHAAQKDGYDAIIDGTNASDDASDRPGMRALREMQVYSPLRLCGISKAQVRQLSREAGLFTWNKPAYACLATRVPAGRKITPALLERVEHAENVLFAMGFSNFRARLTERGVRLEMADGQLDMLIEKRQEILAVLGSDFQEITLDLRLRGGLEG